MAIAAAAFEPGRPKFHGGLAEGSQFAESGVVHHQHSGGRTLRGDGDLQLRRACASASCRYARLTRVPTDEVSMVSVKLAVQCP